MDGKLQELTQKIYEEGIEKAQNTAKDIIEKAEKSSQDIISHAKNEADEIMRVAREEADELKRTTKSEIQLSARQATSALKSQIIDLIMTEALKDNVAVSLKAPENIQNFITTIISHWEPSEEKPVSYEVLLPAKDQKNLEAYFSSHAKQLMKNGLTLKFSKTIDAGFRIGPEGSTFKISLTDKDFLEFFKQFLRPKIKKLLFDE